MSAAPTITRMPNGGAELRFPYDGALVAALKDAIPPHGRTYDPSRKVWTVTALYLPVAFRLMYQAFGDVAIEDQSPADRAPHAGDAYRVLHLRETAPPELIAAAHKCLARLHHPDKGGSHETMIAINRAAEALKGATS